MRLRRTLQTLTALLATACLPATAYATPTASLHVSLTPDQLGHRTTLAFRLHIDAPHDHSPTPLTQLRLNFPSTLGLSVGGLGLVSCPPFTLENAGPGDCPSNSHMGHGHARAEVTIGEETYSENGEIAILRAAEQNNHVGMNFYLETHTPLNSEVVVPGLLLPGANESQETLQIKVPLLQPFTEGPYIGLVELAASIGSNGLTYHEHIHGHTTNYKPAGVYIPDTCPHGGFPFTANLQFLTGARSTLNTRVPCPENGE